MKTSIRQIIIRAVGKFIAEQDQGQYIDAAHSAIICCTDEAIRESMMSQLPHCCLQFIDTENPRDPAAFTREDAKAIRCFLESLPEDITTLYCCCDWGQSRSAGLAAACMTTIGQDYESIFRSRSYMPNMLVYTMMCETLGCLPSADRLQELKRLRSEASGSGVQASGSIKRILITGDSALFPVIPEQRIDVSIEIRGTDETSIPYTEKELVADRKRMGPVLPGDLLFVMLGVHELNIGFAPSEISARMRKYLLWLRYTNPSAKILLVSSPDTLSVAKVSQEKLAQLADCYRRLADNLQIPFVNMSDWNRSTNTQSVMEYLAANVKMDSVNHT